MRPPKIQRWIDILAVLLSHRYPVSLEHLIAGVPAYQGGEEKPESRRRKFERDKDELRDLGIPIETVEDEHGSPKLYRLPAREFYLPYLSLRLAGRPSHPRRVDKDGYRSLPELSFEPDELEAVAHAAARVRELGDPLLAEHAESAVRKLAVDLPMGATQPDQTHIAPARPAADAEVFSALSDGLHDRKRVSFVYHSIGTDVSAPRTVEPFGLFFLNQHWYLAARAPGEATLKNYRLSRISDPEVNASKPGTPDYEIPSAFRLAEHVKSKQAWELGDGDAMDAVVELRRAAGAAVAAARLGEPVEGHPDRRRFRVRRRDAFARWLLSFAGDLIPVSSNEILSDFQALVGETLAHHSALPPSRPPALR
ncbi:MAG: helix-turn-helix transcriptional regulator [Gemmatimonadales bacterium]